MSEMWSPIVSKLTPYIPGEQPKINNLNKLNTNENPYPPSPLIQAAIEQEQKNIRLYPDPQSVALCQAIANYVKLPANHICVGNGSDEILAHAFNAFFQRHQRLLFPDITYSFYQVYCQLYQIPYELIPLNADMRVELLDYKNQKDIAGIVIANPNAPTGIALHLEEIESLLQAHPQRVVLIDEAYIDFGGESAVSLVEKYANLLVVQTFSKSRSLAGMRVGFAMGQPHLIEAITRIKDSFNSYPVDRIAGAVAKAAIEDVPYFLQCCSKIMSAREGLSLQLEDMGFKVLPSSANFIFVNHPNMDAKWLQQELRSRAILVRHFPSPKRINPYLRITIGSSQQCESLVHALQEILYQN